MSYLGIFRLEFQKAIIIFEIEFVKSESLTHTVNYRVRFFIRSGIRFF